MDLFSELLKLKAKTGVFEYHSGCKEIELVNIIFANDLFIQCGAKEGFMRLIKEVLKEFGDLSGLKPILTKSSCYCACITDSEEIRLSGILGIPTVQTCRNNMPQRLNDKADRVQWFGDERHKTANVKISHKMCGGRK
ncbi:hypothetical protein LIER_21697 [Lithospermum erythrorhizon]|uniref:Uncharacterized protein n=1 Tax=Lithospermum erythrorhizon TaxID=34254 RepID=A0AAV3QTI6_LITER